MLFYENPSKFVPLSIITNYWVSLEQQVEFGHENCEIGAGYRSLFMLAVERFRVRSVDTSPRKLHLHFQYWPPGMLCLSPSFLFHI